MFTVFSAQKAEQLDIHSFLMCCEEVEKAFTEQVKEKERDMFYLVEYEDYLTRDKSREEIPLVIMKTSAMIKAIGYRGNTLFVMFNTRIVYGYKGVTLDIAWNLIKEERLKKSVGKYFNKHVKNNAKYCFERIPKSFYKDL